MDEQAKDRAHRIGQKREVRVYRLITTTKIEEGILSKATMKKDLDAKIIQAGMFNDKASDFERQKRLEDLIRKDYEEEEEGVNESEIPTDDQINEIIARSNEEYEIFNAIDQQRYIDERRDERVKQILKHYEDQGLPHPNPQNVNYRLLQDWEVPEWIRTKPEDPNKLAQEFGMGKRQRKQVNYNDDISEGQWLKIIESGADINEEVEKIKKRRAQQDKDPQTAILGKRARPNADNDDESDEEEEEADYDLEEEDYAATEKVQVTNKENGGLTIQINKREAKVQSKAIIQPAEEEVLVMSEHEQAEEGATNME